MAGRILPTARKEDIEQNPAMLTTINFNEVDKRIKEAQGLVAIESEENIKVASKAPLNKKRVKKQPDVKIEGFCETCGVARPCSCDVAEAKASGNKEKVAALIEQRINRRSALATKLEEKEALAFRTSVRNELSKLVKKATKEMDKTKPKNTTKTNRPSANKKVSKEITKNTSNKNEEIIKKYAKKAGWPTAWVTAMFETADSNNIPESIKLILDNKNLPEEQKKQMVIAMTKESNLTKEQASRVVNYWSEQLGYPKDWAELLVADPEK